MIIITNCLGLNLDCERGLIDSPNYDTIPEIQVYISAKGMGWGGERERERETDRQTETHTPADRQREERKSEHF